MLVRFRWVEESRDHGQGREKTVKTAGHKTLLAIAQEADIPIEAMCGGRGRCGRCKILVRGPASELTDDEKSSLTEEELAGGVRLACRVRPQGNVEVEVPSSKTELMQILTEGVQSAVAPAPDIGKACLSVARPELGQSRGDGERLLAAASPLASALTLGVMENLPEILRKHDHQVTITHWQQRIIGVESGDTARELYGMVVDIGTTTVVGSFVDLHRGAELAVAARLNGQAAYGADVISRINYTAYGASRLGRLQKAVMDTLNGIVAELERKTGISSQQISRAILVGNTCMQHMALGISSTYIARAPYTPGFTDRVDVTAGRIGLDIHPEAVVTFLPNVAGFVGSDTVGVVLATDMAHRPGRVLMIDVGTNGELVVSHDGQMVVCSTAAGPAFEGTQITWGMRAGTGAIEAIEIGEDVEIRVIGGALARGICGSGIIDLVAELLQAGIIDETGRLQDGKDLENLPQALGRRLRAGDTGNEFVVAWAHEAAEHSDIVLTQKDVRELQLAKGAIRAGTSILLAHLGLTEADIDELLLAGAFGNYLRKESAVVLGLLPPLPLDRIRSVGNAARVGARLCLLSQAHLEEATRLARSMRYVELAGRADFQEAFMDAMLFATSAVNGQENTEHNKMLPRNQAG